MSVVANNKTFSVFLSHKTTKTLLQIKGFFVTQRPSLPFLEARGHQWDNHPAAEGLKFFKWLLPFPRAPSCPHWNIVCARLNGPGTRRQQVNTCKERLSFKSRWRSDCNPKHTVTLSKGGMEAAGLACVQVAHVHFAKHLPALQLPSLTKTHNDSDNETERKREKIHKGTPV